MAGRKFSWYLKRGPFLVGRRFYYVFCSADLRIVRCEYRHDVRERGLSDHSALELDFDVCAVEIAEPRMSLSVVGDTSGRTIEGSDVKLWDKIRALELAANSSRLAEEEGGALGRG